jgi:biotin carboxyl carrier protein
MKRKFRVTVDGETFLVEVEEEVEGEGSSPPALKTRAVRPPVSVKDQATPIIGTDQEGYVLAPLPGVVSEVKVTKGSRVEKGAILLVLEAMKMENEIYAPADGMVEEVFVEVGQQVGRGDRLLLISLQV